MRSDLRLILAARYRGARGGDSVSASLPIGGAVADDDFCGSLESDILVGSETRQRVGLSVDQAE